MALDAPAVLTQPDSATTKGLGRMRNTGSENANGNARRKREQQDAQRADRRREMKTRRSI